MTCDHPHPCGGQPGGVGALRSRKQHTSHVSVADGVFRSPTLRFMAQPAEGGKKAPHTLSVETRTPAKLGVAVVEGLVNVIVSGELSPGDSLPPELPLSQQFGVSRTVLRESIKRLEEKGLVSVVQGRGTVVQPTSVWNMMDQVVLTSLIANDKTLGVLDELTIVRARLEAAMAGETARVRAPAELD